MLSVTLHWQTVRGWVQFMHFMAHLARVRALWWWVVVQVVTVTPMWVEWLLRLGGSGCVESLWDARFSSPYFDPLLRPQEMRASRGFCLCASKSCHDSRKRFYNELLLNPFGDFTISWSTNFTVMNASINSSLWHHDGVMMLKETLAFLLQKAWLRVNMFVL